MKLKNEPLCGIKKSVLKEHFDEIEKIVSCPKFICGKCARVANSSCFLCKAKKLRVG